MYGPHYFLVPVNQPLPPPPPFIIMQPMQVANPMPWRQGFNTTPFGPAPVYQGMGAGVGQVPANTGPHRNHWQHHQRFHQAEPQHQYHNPHASFGAVVADRFTGIDPGRIGANNNTRGGKRSKPYSRGYVRRKKNPTAAYELPTEFKGFKFKSPRRMMADGPTPGPSMPPSRPPTPTPTPTPTPVSENIDDVNVQDQPVEEGEVDTISLGDESDAGF